MNRVKDRAPASYRAQVLDTEKRVNLLFDHLNASAFDGQVLNDLQGIADAIGQRAHDEATAKVTKLMTQVEGQQWLVSLLLQWKCRTLMCWVLGGCQAVDCHE
jgi:protein transport protein SEC31